MANNAPSEPLGTTNFDEACEVARDKFAAMNGHGVQAVLRPYSTVASAKPAVPHPFKVYADRAAAKLRDEADAADAETPGKGHNFRDIARRINDDLTPKWGDTDITKLDEHTLNDWIADEYRVEDVAATVGQVWSATPRQNPPEGAQDARRDDVGQSRLGAPPYLAGGGRRQDCRSAKAADDRQGLGEEGEPGHSSMRPVCRRSHEVMTDEWIATANHHGPEIKRMLRTYVATIACTGMRTGLEAKRVRIGHVRFVVQEGRPVILIQCRQAPGQA